MAVQVQVKGHKNGPDIQVLGHDARIERINFEKEVVMVTDIDGLTLAMVPLEKVRFILPLSSDTPVPKSLGSNTALKVHIVGDNEGDFEQVCKRIEYAKKFDTMMADLKDVQFQEGQPATSNLLIALPFDNIRYIDFNFYVEPITPVEPLEKKEKQKTVQTTTNKQNAAPKPNVAQRRKP